MTAKSMKSRQDLLHIAYSISEGDKVLDLGCGDGMLLEYVRDTKGCSVYGVEFNQDDVIDAVAKGIPVLCLDLDEGLSMFPDQSYDVVVLSHALMQVRKPRKLVEEMLRIGKKVIVTFPNFAFWKIRAYLLFKGKMPMGSSVPYTWHETPNIHHTTLIDFRAFIEDLGATIESETYFKSLEGETAKHVKFKPNLRAETAMIVMKKND